MHRRAARTSRCRATSSSATSCRAARSAACSSASCATRRHRRDVGRRDVRHHLREALRSAIRRRELRRGGDRTQRWGGVMSAVDERRGVVVGASSGIGRGFASVMANEGRRGLGRHDSPPREVGGDGPWCRGTARSTRDEARGRRSPGAWSAGLGTPTPRVRLRARHRAAAWRHIATTGARRSRRTRPDAPVEGCARRPPCAEVDHRRRGGGIGRGRAATAGVRASKAALEHEKQRATSTRGSGTRSCRSVPRSRASGDGTFTSSGQR